MRAIPDEEPDFHEASTSRWPWGPEYVLVRFRPRDSIPLFLLGILLVLFFPFIFIINLGPGGSVLGALAGLCGICLLPLPFRVLVRRLRQRGAERRLLESVAREPARSRGRSGRRKVIQALVDCRRVERGLPVTSAWRWDYDRFVDQCRAHGIDPPGCLVDARLVRALRRVPQQRELLESEVIRDVASGAGVIFGVACIAIGLTVILYNWGSWNCCAVPGALLMFAGAALALAEAGQALSNSANEARRRIVACGVFATPKRVMLPAKSLTVVCADRGSVRVDLVNRQGRVKLRFRGVLSPGFIDFWQRWMHPRPRPELWRGEGRL